MNTIIYQQPKDNSVLVEVSKHWNQISVPELNNSTSELLINGVTLHEVYTSIKINLMKSIFQFKKVRELNIVDLTNVRKFIATVELPSTASENTGSVPLEPLFAITSDGRVFTKDREKMTLLMLNMWLEEPSIALNDPSRKTKLAAWKHARESVKLDQKAEHNRSIVPVIA